MGFIIEVVADIRARSHPKLVNSIFSPYLGLAGPSVYLRYSAAYASCFKRFYHKQIYLQFNLNGIGVVIIEIIEAKIDGIVLYLPARIRVW